MSTPDFSSLPPVISAQALVEHLLSGAAPHTAGEGSERLVIADLRWDMPATPRPDLYAEGHIPGAIFVDVERYLVGEGAPERGRHPFPDEDNFADSLGELGIAFEDTVIAYAGSDPIAAARFTLMLRLVGVNAALLDGGIDAYLRASAAYAAEGMRESTQSSESTGSTEANRRPLETDPRTLEPTTFPFQPFACLVSKDEVGHSIPTRGAVLVDARPAGRFEGEGETLDPRPGHIPGAVNVPYAQHLKADGTFADIETIRASFEAVGVTKPRITFNYCGSGMSAAVNMLLMEWAGFEHPYLYPGSYSEWSRDETREVETGPAHAV